MTPLRQKIAARLLSAQQETAHLTTFNEVDLSNIIALRTKFQDRFVKKHEVKLGFMSFFVKAVVHALHVVPTINSRIDGEEVVQNHFYDIGVAISTEKGLLVPVLRDADRLSFAGVEKAIGDYAKKARDGKIQLGDLEGGVFHHHQRRRLRLAPLDPRFSIRPSAASSACTPSRNGPSPSMAASKSAR